MSRGRFQPDTDRMVDLFESVQRENSHLRSALRAAIERCGAGIGPDDGVCLDFPPPLKCPACRAAHALLDGATMPERPDLREYLDEQLRMMPERPDPSAERLAEIQAAVHRWFGDPISLDGSDDA